MESQMRINLLLLVVVLLAGCAAAQKRPVLYPNAKVEQAGEAQARRDVDTCIAKAERAGAADPGSSTVGRGAVEGGAIGGATAGVASVIRGGGRVLEDAAAGAAVGATAGAVHGAFRASEPDQVHRNFVQRCLRDLGYEVIGWR